jgi:hypothetical protein
MKKTITALFCLIAGLATAQNIFTWESIVVDPFGPPTMAASFTETVNCITATATRPDGADVEAQNIASFGGGSGIAIIAGTGSPLNVSFNAPIDITAIYIINGNGGQLGTVTITPIGGSNSPVSYIETTNGHNEAVSWYNVTGFNISNSNPNSYIMLDNIVWTKNFTTNISAQTNVSCNGTSNGSATVLGSHGAPYTYTWSPSGGNAATATGLAAGVYTCNVTNNCGATASQTVQITEPTAIAITPLSQTNISCNGGSNAAASINTPTGGAGGYTYNWTPGNPTGDGTKSVVGLTAGSWTCTVTDANACTKTQTFNITQPSALVTTAVASSSAICSNAVATVTVSATGGTPNYTGTGTYTTNTANNTYTVTDANGCTSTKNVSITVNPLPVISSQSGNVNLCGDVSSTHSVNVAGTNTYQWYYTQIGGSDTGPANGAYTEINYTTSMMTIQQVLTGAYNGYGVYCVVTNSNNCSVTSLVDTIVANPLPILMANSSHSVLCSGHTATISVSGASTYTWSTSANTANIAVSPTVQTTYTVTGTNANGCANTTTITQDVSLCTGIETLTKDASIQIYPNPNNGLFTLELKSTAKINVTNALGQVVLNETFEAGKHSLDIQNQSKGIYFVKVTENNKQQTIKIIKE